MLEAAQIEMLILKGMGQLVRHNRFLRVQIDPVSNEELFRPRLVIASDLFAQQFDEEFAVVKISRRKTKFFPGNLSRMYLRRSHILIQVFDNHTFDLRPRLYCAPHWTQDR